MSASNSLHYWLCCEVARWLKSGRISFKYEGRCKYAAVELVVYGAENPDAWACYSMATAVIEVKTSHADFLADQKKYWRSKEAENWQAGNYRAYCAPRGIISKNEVPEKWGLIEWDSSAKTFLITKTPPKLVTTNHADLIILQSILRREGFKQKIYNYRENIPAVEPTEFQPSLF